MGAMSDKKPAGALSGRDFAARRRGTWIDRAIARDCRHADARRLGSGGAGRARGRSRQRAHRRHGDRSDRRHRTAKNRHRPHPGVDRSRRRRHRPPHRGARTRGRHQLGGVRAHQHQRRADRPADRRAALPHGRLRPVLARPRPVAHRHHHALDRRPAGEAKPTTPPTFSASRSIPAPSSPSSPNCAPTGCRRSICGSRTPTRTRSTPSRSITASSSASPDCWRCSSPSCSWSRARSCSRPPPRSAGRC